MSGFDYWEECIAEALEDAGIVADIKQIATVASWAEGAHENYGLATGEECIPNPLAADFESTKRELSIEKNKVICRECNGHGRITTHGPCHSSNSECTNCHGEGRYTL